MKKLFFALFAIALLSSCGGDSDCAAADYVGEYEGSITCVGGVTEDDFTVTITAGDSDKKLNYSDSDGQTAVLNIDECTAKWDNKVLGIGEEISITLDSDGNLTGFRETSVLVDLKCDFDVTKK